MDDMIDNAYHTLIRVLKICNYDYRTIYKCYCISKNKDGSYSSYLFDKGQRFYEKEYNSIDNVCKHLLCIIAKSKKDKYNILKMYDTYKSIYE